MIAKSGGMDCESKAFKTEPVAKKKIKIKGVITSPYPSGSGLFALACFCRLQQEHPDYEIVFPKE